MKINLNKFLFLFLFTFTGIRVSAETLLVHKTQYFDIIYAKSSEVSAALIAEHADSFAEEISSRFNRKKIDRMPVYIVPNKEYLNGYFTKSPYRRIVLFDTTPAEGELTCFSDIILKVFYHELTHAISLKYFYPLLPLSFTEGVAVLYESSDGIQGRLHDPLIMHHFMQGRLDGESPSWTQAAGQRDVYPGAFWGYIYGAGFAGYLQKIYGSETYAQYWQASFSLFPKGKTKKIFNKKLDVLWDNFIESIYFPQDALNPILFSDKTNKSGYNVTASTSNGFACFDFSKKEVVFYTADGKSKKLFNANSTLSHLSFSQDGKYFLVTDTIETIKGEKFRSAVFDMQSGKFTGKEYFSLRYASFCSANKICGIEVNGQSADLILINEKASRKKEILFSSGPGKQYSAIYNPVFAGKDKIAFIAANGIERDILIIDTVSKEIKKIEFKTPLTAIRYLQTNNSQEEPILSFSWAGKNMLYRSALYNVKTGVLKILNKDISGGIFFPVVLQQKEPQDVFYIGLHAKYNSIYKIKETEFENSEAHTVDFTASTENTVSKAPKFDILHAKKYNYFSWLWRVSPFPVIKIPADFRKLGQYGLGLNLSGLDASELLEFSASSVFYFKPFFYQPEFTFQVNSKPANFTLNVYDINNEFKYRRAGITLKSDLVIPTKSVYHAFLLSAGMSFEAFSFFPKNFDKVKTLYNYALSDTVLSEGLTLGYIYEKTKSRLSTNFFAKNTSSALVVLGIRHGLHLKSKTNGIVLQALAAFKTPVVPLNLKISSYTGHNAFVNPIAGRYAFFGNSAFVGMETFLPEMKEYAGVNKSYSVPSGKNFYGLGFDTELTLFSYEIQTGSLWLPIFFNRVNVSAGYRAVLNFLNTASGGKPDFYQSVYGKLTVEINGAARIGVEYAHPIEKVKMGKFSLVTEIDL